MSKDRRATIPTLIDSLLGPVTQEPPEVAQKPLRGPAPTVQDKRSAHAKLISRQRAAEREVVIPAVVDPERREACRLDLLKFAETYFPDDWFCLEPSEAHKRFLRDTQMRVLYGGQKAYAAPRGYGKDTIGMIAAIWAMCFGHTEFFVYVRFKLEHAADHIDAIKVQFEENVLLGQDFPEICACARDLERAPQRAKKQTHKGEFTRIEWGAELVMPTIPGFSGSGCILSPGSISASIRGLNMNGKRPTFILISDPQTKEVARSLAQVNQTLDQIKEDYGGLGSVHKPLACMVLCTVIERHDVAFQLTDAELNPQWAGERYKAIETWPENMELWDEYVLLLEKGARENDEYGRAAHAHYVANRKAMDAGAVVLWPDGYTRALAPDGTPLEVSNLEHLMLQRWHYGNDAFEKEFQNEPPEDDIAVVMSARTVASRLSHVPQYIIPDGCAGRLVQAIDVSAREIHFVVLACGMDGTCSVIEYGLEKIGDLPEGDYRRPTAQVKAALEHSTREALQRRKAFSDLTQYETTDGQQLKITLTLIDSGWATTQAAVYTFCKENGLAYRATKGFQNVPGNRKFTAPVTSGTPTPGMFPGDNYFGRFQAAHGIVLWSVNADYFKLYTHERFLQDPEAVGACSVFGDDPTQHRRFANHIVAEEWDITEGKFKQLSRWNHWLDCLAYAHAAARMCGISLTQVQPTIAKRDYSPSNSGARPRWKIGR